MNRIIRLSFGLLLLVSAMCSAQTKVSPAGHWEGSLSLPSGELKMLVDLDRDAGGTWIGDIDIPQQGVRDLPLKSLTVSGDTVSFALPVGPGDPRFQGKLSDDGSTLSGQFRQGGGDLPLSLKRVGKARVNLPAKNAELADRFTGKWEGVLETPDGGKLRLVFNLTNKEGAAVGTVDSLDQGAIGIPADEISVSGNTIKITVRVVNGGYSGKLSEDGKTLSGEWSQNGGTLSLALTKAASSK